MMLEEADKPVVIVDSRGVVTYINSAFQNRLGWQPAELLGRSLTHLIPEYLRDAHNLGFSRFLTAEKGRLLNRPLQLKALDGEGKEFLADHFIVAEKVDGEWTFGATIEPVEAER